MKTRHKIILTLALGHLILVAYGATGKRPVSPANPVGDGIALYSSLSGADNGYGFFAPGVGAQFLTTFVLTDKHGNVWTDTLNLGRTSEANLRFTGISNLLPSLEQDQMQAVLHSMAGTMLGKHPKAETVAVQLEMYGFDRSATESDFPTMKEYQEGNRPEWLPVLEAYFRRTDVKQTGEEYAQKNM